MIISGEEWVSETGDEAIIIVSDGPINIAVFSHPYIKKIGDQLNEPLHPLDVINMRLSYENRIYANRHSKGLAYDCCAVLSDKNSKIVNINGICLQIEDYIPVDLNEGDLIEFSCSRIDTW